MSKFITFEGGEGCGKTTQIRLLYQELLASQNNVISTREPGGTESAEIIRDILVQHRNFAWDKMTEVMLHMAARNEHVTKVIKPALDEGKIVLCDRFLDSTIVYQGYAMGMDPVLIIQLHELVIGPFYPDLTIILDTDIKLALERVKKRIHTNRYDQMNLDFHQKVREGFKQVHQLHPERSIILDGSLPIHQLSQMIIEKVKQHIYE
jgi:dTMP kinase